MSLPAHAHERAAREELHVLCGTAALVFGLLQLIGPKRGPRHQKTGRWFVRAAYAAQSSERQRAAARYRCYPIEVDRDEIIRVLRAFEVAGLEYVLIGATAGASWTRAVFKFRSVDEAQRERERHGRAPDR